MANKMIDDTECISEWRSLIGEFNLLIGNEPSVAKVKDDLLSIKNRATNNAYLTARQSECIHARCDNYISGKYGNTKTAAHMSHSKTS